MIEPIYIILIIIAIILVGLLYYVIIKEQEQSRKMRVLASAIEKTNRDIYSVEKRLLDTISKVQNSVQESSHDNNNKSTMIQTNSVIKSEMATLAEPLEDELYDLQESVEKIEENFDKRLTSLESTVRTLIMPSPAQNMDNDKIIALYQQGLSLESIAKELRIAPQEVNMVLKLHKFN